MSLVSILFGCAKPEELYSHSSETAQLVDEIVEMMEAVDDPGVSVSSERFRSAQGNDRLAKRSPLWPIQQFVTAEYLLASGEKVSAHAMFRELADWAASDPYGDEWGASGLAVPALWRVLKFASSKPDLGETEANHLLDLADEVMGKKLTRGMYQFSLLPAMPQFEEEIRLFLARLAPYSSRPEEAPRRMMDYLRAASTADLASNEKVLLQKLIDSGKISGDRARLLQGFRLESVKNFEGAAGVFEALLASTDLQVQAEARLHLAAVVQNLPPGERTQIEKLEFADSQLATALQLSTNPRVSEEALFQRALLALRLRREESGKFGNYELFLNEILSRFPNGNRSDNALAHLAELYYRRWQKTQTQKTQMQDTETEKLFFDKSLSYFEKLRGMNWEHEYVERSRYIPALWLYTRGQPEDLDEARRLLRQILDLPNAQLRINTLFWLGRISEDAGEAVESREYFEQVLDEERFDYYSIRARMHLNEQENARWLIWPDRKTARELRELYQASWVDTSVTGGSPYHYRVVQAENYGIYGSAANVQKEFCLRFPSKRMETIQLEELAKSRLLTKLAVIMSLRQDALAAKDVDPSPTNRLQIAGFLGKEARDWPTSLMLLVSSLNRDPPEQLAAAQKDGRFLATAFPPTEYYPLFDRAAKEQGKPVSAELLYSVAREESLFHPLAISENLAFGLFQFTPTAVQEDLDGEIDWADLDDPEASIRLAARWFAREKMAEYLVHDDLYPGMSLFFGIVEHHSNRHLSSALIEAWKAIPDRSGNNRFGDFEFMLEDINYPDTRVFLRATLRTFGIITAAEILPIRKIVLGTNEPSSESRETREPTDSRPNRGRNLDVVATVS